MTDRGGATVTGLAELSAAIDAFPRHVELALRAVAFKTSRSMLAAAKARVPVASGYTRDNIHVIEDPDHKRYIVNAGTDRPRVRFALHTRRSGRKHTQSVTLNMLPNWIEYGTRFKPARPFMRPTADSLTPAYQRDMLAAAEAEGVTLTKF